MIRRLRDDVREHYLAYDPPLSSVERLRAMEAAIRRRRSEKSRRFLLALVLSATAVVGAFSLRAVLSRGDGAAIAPLAREIAEEVARHHHRRLGLEFTASSDSELRQEMDKLDFSLTQAHHATGDLLLLGARYSSLRGHLAAQLRFEDSRGETVTLLETALRAELEGLAWAELHTDGLRVELWQEEGVFLALARAP